MRTLTSLDTRKWQIRIFAACFIAYTAAYICRSNLSIALPGIEKDLGYNNTSLGMIGTALFWVYAIGQLVNGSIGDKVSSRAFVFIGLVLSAALNLLFGFNSLLWVMIIVMGANGLFQSMLWGPIVKTLSHWFPASKNTSVSLGMSITTILGPMSAWALSGLILEQCGWRWVFWLPAVIVSAGAFIWLALARNKPQDIGLTDLHEDMPSERTNSNENLPGKNGAVISLWRLVTGSSLILVAVTGAAQGIIRDSISLWGPKLLMETQGYSTKSAIAVLLMIPLVNLAGIFFAGWLNKLLKSREKITIIILMSGSFLASLGLMFFINTSPVLSIIFIACASAMMFGANPIMTSIIPMGYKKYNKVSSVAGFIDFSIYAGSGLAGVLTGYIVDRFGWNNIFLMWCVASVLGAAAMGIIILQGAKKNETRIGKL